MGNPIIRYEAAQTPHVFEAMTDSGDQTTFSASFSPFSNAANYEPTVAPYGLLTGGAITPNSGTNDSVTVAALTAVMPAVSGADSDGVIAVSSGNVSITRGLTTDTHNITSITIDNTGALAAVSGTDGTAFSETRGAAGGPPLIPVDSIEIGQVRTTTVDAADVAAAEIYQVAGSHVERADYPGYAIDYGLGRVNFYDALPAIHTGGVPRLVYVKGYTPLFAPLPKTSDWAPSEATYSISSTDTYDGPIGSSSSSLGQASFSAILADGLSDPIVAKKGQVLWFEFRPDRDKLLPKQLTQGVFGITRSFPAGGGSFSANCSVTPSAESLDVLS